MIDQFSTEKFERVFIDAQIELENLGFIAGERCYHVALDARSGIRVRSSIHADGRSATAGADSIRVYLVGADAKPLASKEVAGIERWVTRVAGWERRMIVAIDKLRVFRAQLGNCACGYPRMALVSHTPRNPGRVFSKCSKKECGKWGAWLDLSIVGNSMPLDSVDVVDPQGTKKENEKSTSTESSGLESLGGAAELSPSAAAPLGFTADAESLAPVAVKKEFAPSALQVAIGDFVAGDTRNLRVEAVAGSGKTTTNIYATTRLSPALKIKFMVFSKANQLDMAAKVAPHVEATTAHAAGFADIRRAWGNVKLDERKMWNLFRDCADAYRVRDVAPEIVKLVSLCKNTLREPNQENLDWLCDRFGIDLNGTSQDGYHAVADLYAQSLEQTQVIDFDDMVLLPAIGKVQVQSCDVLFVDEAQDTNRAQQEYYRKAGKRIIFVGDVHQAIYGFRGADTDAMDHLSRALNAAQLPLSVSYRCPLRVIELAKIIVPQIEARPGAPDGIVANLTPGQFNSQVAAGDMVLCRTNAPLIRPCFDLIRAGKKAIIKGRDIGKNLMELVNKIERRARPYNFYELIRTLTDYVFAECAKLDAAHKANQAATLQDQFETIVALADGCHTSQELQTRINQIFSDDVAGVVFSTIHKAKGLEAQRVYILRPDLMPFPKATQDWQVEQEKNLQYVAWTRSLDQLYFVQ